MHVNEVFSHEANTNKRIINRYNRLVDKFALTEPIEQLIFFMIAQVSRLVKVH